MFVACLLLLLNVICHLITQMSITHSFMVIFIKRFTYLLYLIFSVQRENLVCCFNKSLYGLKQICHQQFAKFMEAVDATSYVQFKANYSLFTRKRGKSLTVFLIFVDDILITVNDDKAISSLKPLSKTSRYQTSNIRLVKP